LAQGDGLRNYEAALATFRELVTAFEQANRKKDPDLGFVYIDMGKMFTYQRNYEEAISVYFKAFDLLKAFYGQKSENIAAIYWRLHYIQALQENYDSSLYYTQKGLVANTHEFDNEDIYSNPPIKNTINPLRMLALLRSKADSFLGMNTPASIEGAKAALSVADSLVNNWNSEALSISEKLSVFQHSISIYQLGLEACLMASNHSGDSTTLHEDAFDFLQKTKSAVLKDHLSRLVSKKSLLIPEEILKKEQSIKDDITYYRSKLKQLKQGDSTQSYSLKDHLFKLERQQDSLQINLQKIYPAYYNTDRDDFNISLGELQQTLSEDEAVIEYVLHQNYQGVVLLTKDSNQIFQLKGVDNLSNLITSLNRAIKSQKVAAFENNNEMINSSYQLFQTLILPLQETLQKHHIKKLFIVPDRELQYLPFEVLISSMPKEEVINYRELDYLINDYTINYQYSTSLAFRKFKKDRKNNSSFAGFAPSFEEIEEEVSEQIVTRGNAVPLKWNTDEVHKIREQVRGEVFTKRMATEKNFKEKAGQSGIIHLATHAFVDEADPMNSQIVLAHDNDTLQDGILHAFEIYNMELNADLVTLSACNTGYGQLQEGEGTMSLARAFSYAGVPSVVMSHWEVDDKVTSELMILFYKNLKEGMKKDQALRQAKLQLMAENDPAVSNPYYWGAFVVIGDMSPISSQSNYLWYWLAGTCLLIVVLLFIFTRKKSKG